MINDNNFTNINGNGVPSAPEGSAPMRPGSVFQTAGQAMQPPILSPTTISPAYNKPVTTQEFSPMQPQNAEPSAVSQPVFQPQPVSMAQQASVPQQEAAPSPMQPLLTPQMMAPTLSSSPVVEELSKKKKKKEKKVKEAKIKEKNTPSTGKKRLVAASIAFCMLGAGLGVCGMVAYGIHWADQVKSDAVAEAKKAAEKNGDGKGNLSKSGSDHQSTILQGDRDYSTINTSNINTSEKHTASEIYAANVNSTVGISTQINYNYYGYPTTAAASGSGFILTSDGYIVTNYHVIQDANEITVTTFDNSAYDAKVVGYDEENDIAVLKIDADDLTPVILGDSTQLNVGDDVVAIGNPLGELTFSLTKGCVSALDRSVTIDNMSMNLIQTDCAINSGNSGGALFNMYGEVIGITNAKYSNNGAAEATIESIGFAIPISSARGIIESIIEKGYADKPFIGVYAETVDPRSTKYDADEGIGIHDIMDDSPAERAGIKAGDVIIKIDGKKVTDVADLKTNINRVGIGGQMTLTILRDGDEIEIVVDVEADTSS
ncbi:MAG: trypsin-like peptidase domain-containing protein [Clostridiales bacterium]|nr:trypsin-like peptidase domain-containing protein [Clostridiales bacterium]